MVVTQAIMGSEGIGNTSLSRQGSLYGLTLDEVQNQLGNLGKPLGSMNLDELLRTIWTAEAIYDGAKLAPSYRLSRELSKKTVEEVWSEILKGKGNRNSFGEMTLEEFLDQAVVQESQWIQQYQMIPQQKRHSVVLVADSAYSDSSMSPTLTDIQALGRKRGASGDGVERRQKRMIKNRESAARSRARRQAYTNELEFKVSRLEDENRKLRRLKEMEKVLPIAPLPEPKYQLRRTSSSPF